MIKMTWITKHWDTEYVEMAEHMIKEEVRIYFLPQAEVQKTESVDRCTGIVIPVGCKKKAQLHPVCLTSEHLHHSLWKSGTIWTVDMASQT